MSKTNDALGRLAVVEEELVTEVDQVLADIAAEPQKLADTVAKALADAGVSDEASAAAIEAATNSAQSMVDKIKAAFTPTPADQLPPVPEGGAVTEEPPALVVVTVFPTSITGQAGTPVSGHFTASGGEAPFTFAVAGTFMDLAVTPDGFFAINPTEAGGGSVTVTATDANGVESSPTSVSLSISPAS